VLLVGILLVLYSSQGGIKAITTTGVMYFIAIVAIIPLVTYFLVYKVGGIRALFNSLPSNYLAIVHHPKLGGYLFHSIWYLFPAFPLSFPFIQHMLMAQNTKSLTSSYHLASIFLVVFFLLLTLVGLSAIVIHRDIDENVPSKGSEVFLYMVKNYFSTSCKGFIAVGLLAGVMSTADSFLHTAGLLLTHDVIQPFCRNRNLAIPEYKVAKMVTIFAGFLALLGAYNYDLLPYIQYAGVSLNETLNIITRPVALVFTIPLIAGIMGLKGDAGSFFTAFFGTIIVFILSYLYLPPELVVPVGIVTNALIFLSSHFIRNRGFFTIKYQANQQIVQEWKFKGGKRKNSFVSLLPTVRKIVEYSQNKLTRYGSEPTLFAFWLSFSYMMPVFMHSYADPVAYSWLIAIRIIGVLLCVGLLLKPYWPKQLLSYFPIYYHFVLLYCLPFTASFLFFLEGSSIEWLINITLVILLLITLVDWVTFMVLTLLGTVIGIVVYSMLLGRPIAAPDSDTMYILVYALTFSTLIGLLFARRKQQRFDTLNTQKERLTLDHQEVNDDLLSATEESMRFVSLLKKSGIKQLGSVAHLSKRLLELSKEKGSNHEFTTLAQQLTDQLTPMALNMDRFIHRTTGFLLLDGVETLLLDNFLQALQQTLYEKDQRLKIEVRTQLKTLQCDIEKMKKVILNGFSFVQSVAGEREQGEQREQGPVLLGIEDTRLGYAVDSVSPDHIKKIRALRFAITTAPMLPKLAALYTAQIGEESIMKPGAPTNMPLLANERIVKAHYGYSSTISESNELTLVYVIPVNLREVRSKDMDTPQMQLGALWPRADDTYPGAQQQEMEFLQAVQERSQADLTLVEKAINLLKHYHGPVMRQSGEPFYLHSMAVAQIVLDYNTEEATVLGALLHDTVEDTPLTLEQIKLFFNKEVRDVVNGVTQMESNKETLYKVKLSHPENIHRLLGAEDKRVLYVKLADRLHNMRTIQAKSYESQHKTAEETLLFFVSLAKYLGLSEAAEELRNRSFYVLGK